MAVTLDSGAAAPVWPKDANYGTRQKTTGANPTFKTATGEVIVSNQRRQVTGLSEWGQKVVVGGWSTEVRKPLASVGEITDKGRMALMNGNGGFLVNDPDLQAQVERLIADVAYQHPNRIIPLHKEKGVYNMYLKVDAVDKIMEEVDLPVDDFEDENGEWETVRASGNRRRGRFP